MPRPWTNIQLRQRAGASDRPLSRPFFEPPAFDEDVSNLYTASWLSKAEMNFFHFKSVRIVQARGWRCRGETYNWGFRTRLDGNVAASRSSVPARQTLEARPKVLGNGQRGACDCPNHDAASGPVSLQSNQQYLNLFHPRVTRWATG